MKILVVGLDCAAPSLLLGDERLTNIRRLMAHGCYGALESVEPAAQARVHGAPGQLEHPRDLPGRVLEDVAEDDDGAAVGRERSEGGDHVLVERGGGSSPLLGGGVFDRLAHADLAP